MNFEESVKRFRAYDSKNEKFAFVGFHILGEVTLLGALEIYKHENKLDFKQTLELKITQFSGFSDDYAADIYEGDILSSFAKTETLNLLVKIENGCFVLYHRLGCWGLLERYTELTKRYEDTPVKVIGNIYENPQLLD